MANAYDAFIAGKAKPKSKPKPKPGISPSVKGVLRSLTATAPAATGGFDKAVEQVMSSRPPARTYAPKAKPGGKNRLTPFVAPTLSSVPPPPNKPQPRNPGTWERIRTNAARGLKERADALRPALEFHNPAFGSAGPGGIPPAVIAMGGGDGGQMMDESFTRFKGADLNAVLSGDAMLAGLAAGPSVMSAIPAVGTAAAYGFGVPAAVRTGQRIMGSQPGFVEDPIGTIEDATMALPLAYFAPKHVRGLVRGKKPLPVFDAPPAPEVASIEALSGLRRRTGLGIAPEPAALPTVDAPVGRRGAPGAIQGARAVPRQRGLPGGVAPKPVTPRARVTGQRVPVSGDVSEVPLRVNVEPATQRVPVRGDAGEVPVRVNVEPATPPPSIDPPKVKPKAVKPKAVEPKPVEPVVAPPPAPVTARGPRVYAPSTIPVDEFTPWGAQAANKVVRNEYTWQDGQFHSIRKNGKLSREPLKSVSLSDMPDEERAAFLDFMREYGDGGERNYVSRREVLAGGKPNVVNGSEIDAFDIAIPRREVEAAIRNYKDRSPSVTAMEEAHYAAMEAEYKPAPDVDAALEEYDFGDPFADVDLSDMPALESVREQPYGNSAATARSEPASRQTGATDAPLPRDGADTGNGRPANVRAQNARPVAPAGEAGLAPPATPTKTEGIPARPARTSTPAPVEPAPTPEPVKARRGRKGQRGHAIAGVPDIPGFKDWKPRFDSATRRWLDPLGNEVPPRILRLFRSAGALRGMAGTTRTDERAVGVTRSRAESRARAARAMPPPRVEPATMETAKARPRPAVEAPKAEPKALATPKETPKAEKPQVKPPVVKEAASSRDKAARIRDVDINEQLVRNGEPELDPADAKSWETNIKNAIREGYDKDADGIVARGEQLTSDKAAGIAIRMAEIQAEQRAASAAGDTAEVLRLVKEHSTLARSFKPLKSETARTLSAFRMALDPDEFTLVKVVENAEVARKRRLTDSEVLEFDGAVKEIEASRARTKKLEAAHEETLAQLSKTKEEAAAKALVEREGKKTRITSTAKGKVETLRKGRDADIAKFLQLTGRANVGIDPEAAILLRRIAMSYVKEGHITLDAVVKRTMVDVKGVTREEIISALAAKIARPASKQRMELMRQQKSVAEQARLTEEIADAVDGVFRTPGAKASPTPAAQEVQRLRAELAKVRAEAGQPSPKDIAAARARAKSLDEREARLKKELADATRGVFKPRVRGTPRTEPPHIKALRDAIKKLRRENYQSGKTKAQIEAMEKTLLELQEVIDGHARMPKPKAKADVAPELEAARAKVAELRKLANAKERGYVLQERLDQMESDIADGTYKPEVKPPPKVIPDDVMDARIYNKLLEQRVRELARSQEPLTAGKLAQIVRDTMNDLTATADVSATLRQGWIQTMDLALTDPKRLKEGNIKALDAFKSKAGQARIEVEIESNPFFPDAQRAGLVYNRSGMPNHNDWFRGSAAESAPVIGGAARASSRHMTSYLNWLRHEAFYRFMEKYPNATAKEMKDWARTQNTVSGVGDFGKYGAARDPARWILRAPGYNLSRVQVITRALHNDYSPRVRHEMAAQLVRSAGVGMSLLATAALAGYEVGVSPDDPDFGKIVIANHHIDIWHGEQQAFRVVARIGKLVVDKATGKKNKTDPADVTFSYFKYRMNALNGTLYSLMTGKDVVGNKVTPLRAIARGASPITGWSVYDAWKDGRLGGSGGLDDAALVGGLETAGVSVGTYDKKRGGKKGIRAPR